MQIDTVNLTEAKQIVEIAIDSRANVCLEGDPGIGKTALIRSVASAKNLPLETLIGSALAPEDLAMPVRNQEARTIEQWILGPLARLIKQGSGVLFLDEITDTQRAVWSALQRAVNEREIGDVKIPDGIAIVMACNSAKVATGGQDLSWPVVGRITFVRVGPEAREVAEIFQTILAPKATGTLASLLADFGASLDVEPDLLQVSPPDSPEAQPWGAPRSWERGLTLAAKAIDSGHPIDSKIVRALLTGSVGRDPALGFLALHAIRAQLPSANEIVKDPTSAKLPGLAAFAACAGVIAQVGIIDAHAGWIYASRLVDESKLIAGRILTRCPRGKAQSPHANAGAKARVILEAEIGKTQRIAA